LEVLVTGQQNFDHELHNSAGVLQNVLSFEMIVIYIKTIKIFYN